MTRLRSSKSMYFQKDERGKKLSSEVEEWFLEKDGDCLFSFEYICETLELHQITYVKG